MRWYADNSELSGYRGAKIPDILLFGGIAVPHNCERQLQAAIEKVKSKYGIRRAPVKWNFKNLESVYRKHQMMQKYYQLLRDSKKWRREMFEVAATFPITIIFSCVQSYSITQQKMKAFKSDQAGMVFANGLMRFALHVQETKPRTASVMLDWPDKNDPRPYDTQYAFAYCSGKTPWEVSYRSGPLQKLGFSDSVAYSTMHHSTLLQFADLVIGASREFIECALSGDQPGFGVEMVKVVKHRLRGAPNHILGRGIDVSTGNKTLRVSVEAFIKKTLKN